MILIKTIQQAHSLINSYRHLGKSIGFVPTMGALHKGHITLIENCKKEHHVCICSIFINPTQFNDLADFEKYPVTIEKDIDVLEESGCDVLFLPSEKEMYPPGSPILKYNLGPLEKILEGKFRPGHFQGVCQIVDRLLFIIHPDELFLGQKDYQQCLIIKKLIRLKNYPIKVNIVPTVREENGLARSSRNMRLNENERLKALAISQTLFDIKKEINIDSIEKLKQIMASRLENMGFKVDYVEIADAETLEPVLSWNKERKIVALIAAYLNGIRLIDNLILN